MKITVIKPNDPEQIPDIGEIWKYSTNSNFIYMRVSDQAYQCFHLDTPANYFYSVDLTTGKLGSAEKKNPYPENKIIILEQAEGALLLQEKKV